MKKNTENKEPKRLRTCHKVIFAIESILLVLAIIFGIYALDYYHADDDAKIIIKGINILKKQIRNVFFELLPLSEFPPLFPSSSSSFLL